MSFAASTSALDNEAPLPIPPRVEKMASVGDMSTRTTSSRRTTKSSKGHVVLQAVEIIHEKDREILDLRNQLERERTRADIAKEDVKEVVKRFHVLHAQKTAAVKEAAKWKAQLQGYMDGLDRARRDLTQAHALIQLLEQQRNGAEDEARDAKALVVQLREEREVVIAREEGRRQGFLEGLTRARAAESIHVQNTEPTDTGDDDEEEDDLYADAPTPRQQSPERVVMPEPSVHAPSPPQPPPQPSPQPVYNPPPPPPVPIFDTQPPANFPVPVPAPAPPTQAVPLSTIQEDVNEPILTVPPPSTHHIRSRRDSETGSSASISQFDILHNRAGASTSRPGTSHSRRAPDTMPTPVPMPQAHVPRHYPSYTTLNMPISSRDAGFDPDSPTRKTLSPEDSDSDDDDDESNDNYTVTVQGPSRSASNSPPDPPEHQEAAASHLLSAADALRPTPLPQPSPQVPVISDLPPGFVVSGFTPGVSPGPLPGSSGMPGGLAGASSASTPVIPSSELMRQAGQAEEDDSTSSGMSGESGLTTPPARSKRSKEELTSKYSSYLAGSSPVLPPVFQPSAPVPTPSSQRGKGKGKRGARR
ncbi:hypothetical protein BDZ89DRAFT_1153482 [Hymenopellis radicata]|nr:hypothetical protein BDZ89DRAFT_1153482 [Hymenopellis radicata]